jgi:opacity protein-like surface antigen
MIQRTGLILIAIVAVHGAAAQAADKVDLRSRAGIDLNLNLPNKWLAGFEYQNRMVDNLSTYRGSYFTAELGRNLTKQVEVFGSYRYGLAENGNLQRYAFGLEYERKSIRWRLGFRPMVQHKNKVADDDETGGTGTTFVRTRAKAEYVATPRLDLYASVEPFFAFGQDYPIDNWRNTVGFQYECARNVKVDVYYTYRPDYGKSYNRVIHVVGLTLRFKTKIRGR